LNEGKGKQQFEISLRQVFGAFNNLLADRADSDSYLGLQTTVLKYLPDTITEIIKVLDPAEFRFGDGKSPKSSANDISFKLYSQDLVVFLNSAPRGKLTRQKMMCMISIVHTTLFKFPGEYTP
jgi:hypothetical protein